MAGQTSTKAGQRVNICKLLPPPMKVRQGLRSSKSPEIPGVKYGAEEGKDPDKSNSSTYMEGLRLEVEVADEADGADEADEADESQGVEAECKENDKMLQVEGKAHAVEWRKEAWAF